MQQEILDAGDRAWRLFSEGLATGNWQPFLDILTEDFTFWFPVGQFQGQNCGKEKAAEFFAYVSAAFPKGLKVSLERVTGNDRTIVFEFRSEGMLRGMPYQNQVAVSFDFKGDKICAYREYLAVVFQPASAG